MERSKREGLFKRALKRILEHNNAKDSTLWKMGVNRFTDMTEEEQKRLRGVVVSADLNQHTHSLHEHPEYATLLSGVRALPPSVDWRQKVGVLTPVKDQGQCGSCWAFSTVEAVESYWALKTGNLQEFSEQFVLDCTVSNGCGGTGGCQGATPKQALATIEKFGGIPSEWTYPYSSYSGTNGASCGTAPSIGIVSSSYHFPTNTNDSFVMSHLANVGPLIIEVDAGPWMSYESGILPVGGANGCTINAVIDHGVLLVGYGVENGVSYWIVRNSWSAQWGEHGYIRLQRSSQCGFDTSPLAGNGCPGGPKKVPVCGPCGLLYSIQYPLVQ